MEDVCLQKRWKTTTWLIYDQLLLLYVISFSSVHQITKNRAFSFISPWGTAGPEHLALQCCIKSSKHQIKNLEEIPTLQLWSLRCTGRVPSSGSQEDGIPNKTARTLPELDICAHRTEDGAGSWMKSLGWTADSAGKPAVSSGTPSDDAKKKKILSFTSCLYSNIFSQFQILSYFIEWKVLNWKGSGRIMLHFLTSQETLFMVTCQIV